MTERTTTRSIRIPLSLDDKVSEFQKKSEDDSYTQALLRLVKLGFQSVDFKKEVEENPEKIEEIRIQYDDLTNRLLDEKVMSEEFGKLTPKELDGLGKMVEIEKDHRERQAKKEEELERQKRQKENLELIRNGLL